MSEQVEKLGAKEERKWPTKTEFTPEMLEEMEKPISWYLNRVVALPFPVVYIVECAVTPVIIVCRYRKIKFLCPHIKLIDSESIRADMIGSRKFFLLSLEPGN